MSDQGEFGSIEHLVSEGIRIGQKLAALRQWQDAVNHPAFLACVQRAIAERRRRLEAHEPVDGAPFAVTELERYLLDLSAARGEPHAVPPPDKLVGMPIGVEKEKQA